MPYFISSSGQPRHTPVLDHTPSIDELNARKRQLGLTILLGTSQDLPVNLFPQEAHAIKPIKSMPDVINGAGFYAFSETLREIVERLEPGVHQFSPEMKVFYKDGRPAEKKYYCINIKTEVRNQVIWEQSKVPDMLHLHGWDDELVLNANLVGKLHLWRAPDMLAGPCISDIFYKELKKAKISGFIFQRQLIGTR